MLAVPPFTLKDIRDAVPAELFVHSLPTSLAYLASDLLLSAAITYAALFSLTLFPAALVLPLYWVCQGAVWTALWVIAHECGHGAFSQYRSVNNAVGMVLHTFLLVPYHPWRITHAAHHKSTNHTERDTVFVPHITDEAHVADVAPLTSLAYIVVMLTLGWPAYLTANLTGQTYKRRTNHFEPSSPIFESAHRGDVIACNIALAGMVGTLALTVYSFGLYAVTVWYAVPYLIVNFWLVLITYLQHTDIRVPHFKGEEWSFLRGALGTVDRDYGVVLNTVFHHITDSHVAHHCFSTMPFYNAIKATPYIKKRAGTFYLSDDRSIAKCLWTNFRQCRYIRSGNAELYR